MSPRLEIFGVHGMPEVVEGDDLAALLAERAALRDGDVVVVAQKVVSKAEGRLVPVDPARRDEERARWVERESVRVVARRLGTTVVQTRHGFVCANAGIDASNVPPEHLALLPLDPDGSAARLRDRLRERTGLTVGVVVSDTFGRPWRAGQTNVALGVGGIRPLRDHRGEKDSFGSPLTATVIAIADEIAGAAELVMRKSDGVCAAVVRGLEDAAGEGAAAELVRRTEEDLFRTGGSELIASWRPTDAWDHEPVPRALLEQAVEAAARPGVTMRIESIPGAVPALIGCAGAEPFETGRAVQALLLALWGLGVGGSWRPRGPGEGQVAAGFPERLL